MSDRMRPTRLREDPSASNEVRALLRSGARSRALPDETRARSAARLGKTALVPAAAAAALWKGVAVAAAGIGLAGAVAYKALAPTHDNVGAQAPATVLSAHAQTPTRGSAATFDPPPAPTPQAQSAPAPVAPRALVPSARPSPGTVSPQALPSTAAGSAPAVATPRASKDPLAEEAALLEKARAALDSRPDDALATLNAHRAAFPDGQLGMERELLAVEALRRLGRNQEARARCTALAERARGSIYEPRVATLLRSIP